ncbi:MAG TPA: glycosyltransferase [Longimicrobiaceae bacterium]|nr:glycosyltransferase [Longimicrobiaceae bacterium]
MAESFRAEVPPAPAGEPRPLWSVMIPAYNCAAYLRVTLESVLAQDPGPGAMQIEVVDDCSTSDDPEAVVREVGGGRVAFYRQARNVGHVGNFETCLLRSRGRLVHLLHGDDAVRPGFYAAMGRAFDARPGLGMAFCRHVYMDEAGTWRSPGPLLAPEPGVLAGGAALLAARQPVQTPAAVVRREVYERLGGFDRRMPFCGEDWEMWVRIASQFPVWYEPEPLALYRRHAVSLTGRSLRTGENLRDLRRAVGIYRAYLPAAAAEGAATEALERTALWGVELAARLLAGRDRPAALAQLREALRCSRSPRVLGAVALLLGRSARHWARRGVLAVGPGAAGAGRG